MNEDEQPIYDFAPLKAFLEAHGYTIGNRAAYEPFTPEDITATDITNGTMSFTDDGIFVIGSDGHERQVFLYKKDYHLERYGKPRFHICKCATIEEFISVGLFKQHYVRANSEPVPVIDLDDSRKLKTISGLPLCSNCKQKMKQVIVKNSTNFVELLQSANDQTDQEDVEVDIFGYTRDWETISRAYREKKNYTCERCGLEITDTYDRQYVHVHHKDGNKLNNNENNLQCLCLYCHAHVDDHHLQRLTTTDAKRHEYEYFVNKYKCKVIIQAYRQQHNYTCENCGLEITDTNDRQYVHTHHKDGNKQNNNENNLQCLCLYCHANIDDYHFQKWAMGDKRTAYEYFVNKYK